MSGSSKWKITLSDITGTKEDKVMDGEFEMSEILQAGQTGCAEFRYDTYYITEVVNIAKKSKKSVDTKIKS